MSSALLLELHLAAAPFLRRKTRADEEQRARLRRAVIAVLRERGAEIPGTLIDNQADAIDALRKLLQRCDELRVNWVDIVALVNREYTEAPRG